MGRGEFIPEPGVLTEFSQDGWTDIDSVGGWEAFLCEFNMLEYVPRQHQEVWAWAWGEVLRRIKGAEGKEMERALKSNRVPKVDQVDKLREHLSGFALSLVPDSVKDIEVAFKALEDQWGDPGRVLESRQQDLKKLGNLPGRDGYGKENYQNICSL